MQVIVDGLLTHYVRAGKGPVVLIFPGWADTSRSWQPIHDELSASYDCVVIDLPGFGGTQQPPTAWGLDEYAEFVEHFLAKIGVKDVRCIIGHSNGGAIAIRGIAAGRLRTKKLILAASAGVRSERGAGRSATRVLVKTSKALSAILPAGARAALRRSLHAAMKSDMLVAEHMQETFKKIVTDDVQADAGRITVPTLLIYGDKDTDTPIAFARTFQRLIKGSSLEILPGAGHFIHVEQTGELVRLSEDFLA